MPAARRWRERLAALGLGLEGRLGDRMGLLSGGQRQAVALLMATMAPSKILLLDEHTAALDPRTAEFVLGADARLVAELRLTTLMVTHSMQQALSHGDRLLMLHEGRICLDVAGEAKARLGVEDLLAEFRRRRGVASSTTTRCCSAEAPWCVTPVTAEYAYLADAWRALGHHRSMEHGLRSQATRAWTTIMKNSQKSRSWSTFGLMLIGATAGLPSAAGALTLTVNRKADAVDAQPGNGICATAAAKCSLRAAIQEANAWNGTDTIKVPAGTYALTLKGKGETAGATGDLNITNSIVVEGAGAAKTIIDGGVCADVDDPDCTSD